MHFAETLARKQSGIPTEGSNREEQRREEKEIQQSTKAKLAVSTRTKDSGGKAPAEYYFLVLCGQNDLITLSTIV